MVFKGRWFPRLGSVETLLWKRTLPVILIYFYWCSLETFLFYIILTAYPSLVWERVVVTRCFEYAPPLYNFCLWENGLPLMFLRPAFLCSCPWKFSKLFVRGCISLTIHRLLKWNYLNKSHRAIWWARNMFGSDRCPFILKFWNRTSQVFIRDRNYSKSCGQDRYSMST